ncbi:MAG: hypothetical protein KF704_16160 [Crocinitomicaceae bacterium]|nr:hypothetical protein [Crocinitomicaceae bacterium]NGF77308.1 hypothetical protein [Fluviicola sp. SGL-29]
MMKSIFLLLSFVYHIGAYGQSDTIVVPEEFFRLDCAHGHSCCAVGCYCCKQSSQFDDHLKSKLLLIDPDDLKTISPDDGLTYNQYIGENIAGFYPADGWRTDTINGGFNKNSDNPYISSVRFEKGEKMVAYRYENGKLFTGRVKEILTVSFTPDKIAGYLPNGQSYYETKNITVEFSADCVNGLLQGRSVLLGRIPQYGIYDKLPLSECYFENGEIVGICKHWDLNSVAFTIKNGNIYSNENEPDYFAFCKLLEVSEITYIKGSSDYIRHTIFKRVKKQVK